MLYLKNITWEELLDFAEYVVNKHKPIDLYDDLIQIKKFREYVSKVKPNDQWLFFIEGWVTALASKYNEDIYKWSGLRKRKLKNIKNGKSTKKGVFARKNQGENL